MENQQSEARSKWKRVLRPIRTFVLYVLVVLGTAVLLGFGFALHSTEWHPHFVNLVRSSWRLFQDTEGSKTTGIISNWIYPLFIVAITMCFIWRERGLQAVVEHWRKEALTALRVTGIVCLLVYGPVFVWSTISAVYSDHKNLVEAANNLRTENVSIAKERDDWKVKAGSKTNLSNQTVIQVDPKALAEALDTVRKKERATEAPSLRSRVLDLSKRILTFAMSRQKEEPQMQVVHTTQGEKPEDVRARLDAQFLTRSKFDNESSARFMASFGTDVALLLGQLSSLGIDVKQAQFMCQNPSGIMLMQNCGTSLAALADQVPSDK